MEVSLDHFSGHCLWSGRDQSFQNVTSKNDPVWNAANPFRFLSTVSTQGIRFFKSKVQNSIAEGFIAPAPGSPSPPHPHTAPTVSPNALCGYQRQERAGPAVLRVGASYQSLDGSYGLLCRLPSAAEAGRQGTWGREEARSSRSPPNRAPRGGPGSDPERRFAPLTREKRAVSQPQPQRRSRVQKLLWERWVWLARVLASCCGLLLGGEEAGGDGSLFKSRDIHVACR